MRKCGSLFAISSEDKYGYVLELAGTEMYSPRKTFKNGVGLVPMTAQCGLSLVGLPTRVSGVAGSSKFRFGKSGVFGAELVLVMLEGWSL